MACLIPKFASATLFVITEMVCLLNNEFEYAANLFLNRWYTVNLSSTRTFHWIKYRVTSHIYRKNVNGLTVFLKERSDVYQQLWLLLPLCQSLCHKVSYLYSKILAYGRKNVFGQYDLNTQYSWVWVYTPEHKDIWLKYENDLVPLFRR